MEQEKLISVIVPVYNVEAFLEPCVRSIIGQTYRRLEIILVDDGSPDNCPQMCEQWAQKDERIRVLHKENGGLSDARNAGLKAATGEFVLFVDSDDWIAPEMAEKMLDAMVEYKADMVLCQYTEVFPNGKMLRKYDGKRAVRVYGRQEMFKLLLEDLEVTNHVWRRLYKRKLLPENLFPVGKNFEDMYVMAELTEKCETFVSLNDVYYYYRANPNGIMKTKTSKNLNDYLDALEKSHADICRFCPEMPKAMQDSMRRMRGLTATYLWEDVLVVPTLTSEERKQIRERVDKWADMLPEEVPGLNARQRTYYRLFQENDLRAARIWYELWFNQNNWWCHLKKAVKKAVPLLARNAAEDTFS